MRARTSTPHSSSIRNAHVGYLCRGWEPTGAPESAPAHTSRPIAPLSPHSRRARGSLLQLPVLSADRTRSHLIIALRIPRFPRLVSFPRGGPQRPVEPLEHVLLDEDALMEGIIQEPIAIEFVTALAPTSSIAQVAPNEAKRGGAWRQLSDNCSTFQNETLAETSNINCQ